MYEKPTTYRINAYVCRNTKNYTVLCGNFFRMSIKKSNFQTVVNGDSTDLYVLKNANGIEVCVTNYGGRIVSIVVPDSQTVVLSYLSPDGEAGFPGNLNVKVTMKLTDGNPINTILDHILMINADGYTPIDSTFMTTGKIEPVEGTPMDFRTPTPVGERIDSDFEQLKFGKGYDHNWVLNTKGDISQLAAAVYCPQTNIRLEVYTIEPGLQVYTGNFLDGTIIGKKGIVYNKRTAICLETQKFPDSPNKPDWPSPYLKPGEKYTSRCIYKFSIQN